jgi:hypothetical protein
LPPSRVWKPCPGSRHSAKRRSAGSSTGSRRRAATPTSATSARCLTKRPANFSQITSSGYRRRKPHTRGRPSRLEHADRRPLRQEGGGSAVAGGRAAAGGGRAGQVARQPVFRRSRRVDGLRGGSYEAAGAVPVGPTGPWWPGRGSGPCVWYRGVAGSRLVDRKWRLICSFLGPHRLKRCRPSWAKGLTTGLGGVRSCESSSP